MLSSNMRESQDSALIRFTVPTPRHTITFSASGEHAASLPDAEYEIARPARENPLGARTLGGTHSMRAAPPARSAPCRAAGSSPSRPRRRHVEKRPSRGDEAARRPPSALRPRHGRGDVATLRTCTRASCTRVSRWCRPRRMAARPSERAPHGSRAAAKAPAAEVLVRARSSACTPRASGARSGFRWSSASSPRSSRASSSTSARTAASARKSAPRSSRGMHYRSRLVLSDAMPLGEVSYEYLGRVLREI